MPIVDTIHSKGNKFVKGVKIKATGDLILNYSCGMVRKDMYVQPSGGSRGGAQGIQPPLILSEKRRNRRRKKSRQGKKNTLPPPPTLAQGLDPSLIIHEATAHVCTREEKTKRIGFVRCFREPDLIV